MPKKTAMYDDQSRVASLETDHGHAAGRATSNGAWTHSPSAGKGRKNSPKKDRVGSSGAYSKPKSQKGRGGSSSKY